jgi:hypothetical protein
VPGAEEPYVTESLTVGGRTSNLEGSISTDLHNSWAFFDLGLVNEGTGRAVDFAREVGYYEGVDEGERWSEGSRRDRVRIPRVPPGRYYLRVAPQIAPEATAPVRYTLALRRDVPNGAFFFAALVLLLVPPVWVTMRAAAFESRRWAESDYGSPWASATAGADEDDS